MIRLAYESLSAAPFAPFGEVMEDKSARRTNRINDGTTLRFDGLTEIFADGGRTAISLFRASPREPIIAMLECHPLGSQAFMPAGGGEWLVIVAPGDENAPRWAEMRCFIARGGQGVNYRRGTWHHPLLVTDAERDFWVVDRIAPMGEMPNANLREFRCPPEMQMYADTPPTMLR